MGIEASGVAKKKTITDIHLPTLDKIIQTGRIAPLSQEDGDTLQTALHTMAELLLPKWRNNEKLSSLAGFKKREKPPSEPKPGHGRHKADDYEGAQHVSIPHPDLTSGCACPDPDCRGKVYPLKNDPSPLVRIIGMPPLQATVYDLEKLRCNACTKVYTAPPPDTIGPEKYDATVASMIGLFRYGMGMPFHRLEGLQGYLKVPMPASTQWELVEDAAELVKPIYDALTDEAAQGDVLHTDDTSVRILKVLRSPDDKRTGLHTTGVVSVADEGRRFVALYMSGRQHAGENLADVLALRHTDKPGPTLMGDASSWNTSKLSKAAEVFIANCLAHGRRKVVEQYTNCPTECLHILDELGTVYLHDEEAAQQGLNAKERLKYHQLKSEPVMKRLRAWMAKQFADRTIEENSGLGKAIKYLQTHWNELTLFLRHAGAPLDNTRVERALKRAVLHRKNSLFYKTLHGAQVGDIFMSIIHTCELNEVNPFDYLTELQRHPIEVRSAPALWLPWNYREQLLPAPD